MMTFIYGGNDSCRRWSSFHTLGWIFKVTLTLSSLQEEYGARWVSDFLIFLSFSNFYEFSNDRIYTYVQVLILFMFQNTDIGPVRPEGHPCMFVRPVVGGDPGLVRVLEGKLARLTQ